MSYYVKRDEIHNAQSLMVSSIERWLDQLEKVKGAMQMLASSDAITGVTADSIRTYIKEEPITIIDALISCIQFFYEKMIVCANGYANIDDNDNAWIRCDRLKSISETLALRNNSFYNTREAIFRKLNSVSDIIMIGAPSNSTYYDLEGLRSKLSDIQNSVSDYENAHIHDMDDINNIISVLTSALNEALNRTSVQINNYTCGTISSGETMKLVSEALLFAAGNIQSEDFQKQFNLANENRNCYVSDDYTAIVYNGEQYPIVVPDYSGETQSISGNTWEVVYIIDGVDRGCNWIKAISNISIDGDPDPKANPGGVNWNNVDNSVNLISSVINFTDNLLEYSKIKIVLEKDNMGNTRATIGYSTRDMDNYFDNYIYGSYNSNYINAYGDPLAQRYIKNGVSDAYTSLTGESLPDGNYGYSYSWDERHRDSEIQGFVFFDESGNMYKQFLVYGGDNVTIQEYDWLGIPTRDILDVTYCLQEPELMTAEEKELFFKTIEKGE